MPRIRSPRFALASACILAALVGSTMAAERSAALMASAASAFLNSLPADQRTLAAFPFDGDERTRWNYIPSAAFPRRGLTLKAMGEAQRQRAHDLLKTGLSQRGYMTATAIMNLEQVLGDVERQGREANRPGTESFRRDPEEYYFSVFGTPSNRGAWGWRVEGHHVSLHFTVVDGGAVAGGPSFFGSNPAEVREGPQKGLRILGAREDAARALLTSLDPEQRAKAVIRTAAPGDIVTGNKVDIDPLSPAGVTADALTAAQRELLTSLVETYTSSMTDEIAADRLRKIRAAGFEKVAFAWAGGIGRGQKHYYRVQGPSFLIEYDNTQNDANHIHSVWRDFAGDFGRDVLREHLKSVAH